MTFSDGTSVNFNSADAVIVSAIGQYDPPTYAGNKYMTAYIQATASNEKYRREEISVNATAAYDDGYSSGYAAVIVSSIGQYAASSYANKVITAKIQATASNEKYRRDDISIDATAAFNDGKSYADSLYSHYGQAQLYYKAPGDHYVSAGSHNWYYK